MAKRYAFVLAVLLALTAFLLVPRAEAAEGPFVVYVSTTGDDANDGLTPETAIASLQRAETVIADTAPTTNVEVRIEQGTYESGSLAWDTYVPGHTISFLPVDYNYEGVIPPGGRPVFQPPAGHANYWFYAKLPTGHPGGDMGLRFYYLEVTGYGQGGLAFVGNTEVVGDLQRPSGLGLNGNTVYGMKFRNLGSTYNPDVEYGFGGVTGKNSSGNQIVNNHFVHLENEAPSEAGIHGIYLAHGSSNNYVKSNYFEWISGNPMRVRNDSNDNNIRDNTFKRTGLGSYYSDWSCGTKCSEENNGQAFECASHGNLFRYNDLYSGYLGTQINVFGFSPGDASYEGPVPECSNEGQPRVTTASNVNPSSMTLVTPRWRR